jgi:hypothetical protein
MRSKRVLRPERLRRVPAQFSWIDQRLVREGHIQHCGAAALALYLFLLTVADRDGLSYYAERTLARYLSMDEAGVLAARVELMRADLIAYQAPFYQVLSLDPAPPPRVHGVRSVAALLQRRAGGPSRAA